MTTEFTFLGKCIIPLTILKCLGFFKNMIYKHKIDILTFIFFVG